jgi:hypothetical protein
LRKDDDTVYGLQHFLVWCVSVRAAVWCTHYLVCFICTEVLKEDGRVLRYTGLVLSALLRCMRRWVPVIRCGFTTGTAGAASGARITCLLRGAEGRNRCPPGLSERDLPVAWWGL